MSEKSNMKMNRECIKQNLIRILMVPVGCLISNWFGNDIHSLRFFISLCFTPIFVSQWCECKVDYGVFNCFMGVAFVTSFYVQFPTVAELWISYGIMTLLMVLRVFLHMSARSWFIYYYVFSFLLSVFIFIQGFIDVMQKNNKTHYL